MQESERRAYARVAAPLRVTVEVGECVQELAARDISRGGVFLYTREPPGTVGDIVSVRIPMPGQDATLSLRGELLRVVEAPASQGGGVLGIAIQWSDYDADEERKLTALLEHLLLGAGGDKRSHARVSALLKVVCNSDEAMKAMIHDIGRGGIRLVSDRPLSTQQYVEVEVCAPSGRVISFNGRVVRAERPAPGQIESQVAVAFDAPEEAQLKLNALLRSLVQT